jgi:hypothetical protein
MWGLKIDCFLIDQYLVKAMPHPVGRFLTITVRLLGLEPHSPFDAEVLDVVSRISAGESLNKSINIALQCFPIVNCNIDFPKDEKR